MGKESRLSTGTWTHVPVLLLEATWKCYNGCKIKAVPGKYGHNVPMRLVEAIRRCCNGLL